MRGPLKEDLVRPVTDPDWARVSKPVLQFLSEPRDWATLTNWAKEGSFNGTLLRQCLAWLEEKSKAQSFIDMVPNSKGALRERVYWVYVGWSGLPNRSQERYQPTESDGGSDNEEPDFIHSDPSSPEDHPEEGDPY